MSFKLSPTSLGLMKKCSRCFWLEQHNAWKRPSGPFPSLPNGMDRILKVHFDSFRDKGEMPPELRENGECEGMRLFGENDEEKNLLERWRDSRRGIAFEDEEGNILMGAVDNLLRKNGKVIILDYKTRGYAVKENTHEYYRDQLDVYTFLLGKSNYEIGNFAFLLFYVPSKVTETGEVIFDTLLKKMEVDVGNAEFLFRKAIDVLKNECPSRERSCEWCQGVE
jgi:hypothetical protein